MIFVFTTYKLTDGLSYKFLMYISYYKKIKSWIIGYTHYEHNHAMNLNLFSYNIHQNQLISYDKTIELAKDL